MTIKLLSLDAALVTGVLAAYSYYIQWIVPQILAMNVMDTPVAAGKLVLPALAAGILVWYFVKGCWTVTQHHRTLTSAGFGEAELATTPWNTSWGNVPSENRDEPPNANRLLRPRKRVCQYPPPYPNGWFFLATSDDMPKETSKYFAVMGMHIALFRDSKGKVHGIDAYCPHLGANLAVGGIVKDDCIRCPFHGWTFRGSDGQCTNIPYSDCKPPEIAKVRTYHIREVNRLIFVWFDAEGREPFWQIPEVPVLNDPSSNWLLHGYSSNIVACHIQENPENGADVHHLEELHGDFTVKLMRPLGFRHHWTCQWTPGDKEDDKHITQLVLSSTLKFRGIKVGPTRVAVNAMQIGPGIVHFNFKTPLGPVYAIQTVTPLEPLLQRVTHFMFSSPWSPRLGIKSFFSAMVEQYERDVVIFHNKIFMHKPLLTKEDALIAKYRKWFTQFYSESSAKVHKNSANAFEW